MNDCIYQQKNYNRFVLTSADNFHFKLMSMITSPAPGKQVITIISSPHGPVKKKIYFVLQHLNSEYWGCEGMNNTPLILNVNSVKLINGEYICQLKSADLSDLTKVLSCALFDAFIDGQISLERFRLAEFEVNELKWENQRLASDCVEVLLLC